MLYTFVRLDRAVCPSHSHTCRPRTRRTHPRNHHLPRMLGRIERYAYTHCYVASDRRHSVPCTRRSRPCHLGIHTCRRRICSAVDNSQRARRTRLRYRRRLYMWANGRCTLHTRPAHTCRIIAQHGFEALSTLTRVARVTITVLAITLFVKQATATDELL
jgi:hypothetical protein